MKKCICMILAVLLIFAALAGCKNSGSDIGEKPDLDLNPSESPISTEANDSGSSPSGIPNISVSGRVDEIRILMPVSTGYDFDKKFEEEWEAYIYEKYGFFVDIDQLSTEGIWQINIDELSDKSEKGGFVYVSSATQLNALIDSGLIDTVNNDINNIEIYNTLSEHTIQSLTDSNGMMWGFPLTDNVSTASLYRYYNKAWLDDAGLNTPKTVDDFYEYAMFIADYDPDGSGEKLYAAECSDYSVLHDLGDIFRAYGCYPYHFGPIGYNPLKGKFENLVFNENFPEAMSLIMNLQEQDLLISRFQDTGYVEPSQYKTGSTRSFVPDNDFEELAYGFCLTGINDKQLLENVGMISCLAVLKGTDNAAVKLNSFFEMLRSDPNSRMDFIFGIENVSYTENENSFTVNTLDENGNRNMQMPGLLIGLDNLGFSTKNVTYSHWENMGITEEFNQMRAKAIEEAGTPDESLLYTVPLSGYDKNLEIVNSTVRSATDLLFKSILNDGIPIETAIEQYRTRLGNMDVNDLIDEMNSKL